MDAGPVLGAVAAALCDLRLEAVLIGNAGAALQGAPVTTLDFDQARRDLIRRWQALPPENCTNCLRKRLPGGGSSI